MDTITLKNEQGKSLKATWSSLTPEEMEVKVPLSEEAPGKITMLVKQHGSGKPDEIQLRSYSEAAHLDKFLINAGDAHGALVGTRLDEVAGLELNAIRFAPGELSRAEGKDELRLSTAKDAPVLHAGDKGIAHVALTLRAVRHSNILWV